MAVTNEQSDQLGGFVLNGDEALAIGASLGYVAGEDDARGRQQEAWRKLNVAFGKIGKDAIVIKVNASVGCALVVSANLAGGVEAVAIDPALDKPFGMSGIFGEGCGVARVADLSEESFCGGIGGRVGGARRV